MKLNNTKTIVSIGLLIAMQIVLSRVLSINAFNVRIGFGFVPVAMAAVLYGPVGGALVGGLSDVLGIALVPTGPFFPGITLTSILMGVVLGIYLHKKQSAFRVVSAVAINQLVLSLGLNSFWISVLYQTSFEAQVLTRCFQAAVIIPVEIVTILCMSKGILVCRKRLLA